MWTPGELKVIGELSTPGRIQAFLDDLPYESAGGGFSPRSVLRNGRAQCFGGANLAAAALDFHGYEASLVDLLAENDDDHVIAVYRCGGQWGAVAKSNTALLRERRPVYRCVRELAMSYFDFYFNTEGEMTLRSYSSRIPVRRIGRMAQRRGRPDWRFDEQPLDYVEEALVRARHYPIVTTGAGLHPASRTVREACFLGADTAALYDPRQNA